MNEMTQQQVEAIVSLLILARYQDARLTLVESDAFTKLTEQMPWTSGTGLGIYLQRRTAFVRNIIGEVHTKRDFIAEQCALLSSPEAKTRALEAITLLFESDGIDPKESTVLADVKILLK